MGISANTVPDCVSGLVGSANISISAPFRRWSGKAGN
jgi:hypothetical protein